MTPAELAAIRARAEAATEMYGPGDLGEVLWDYQSDVPALCDALEAAWAGGEYAKGTVGALNTVLQQAGEHTERLEAEIARLRARVGALEDGLEELLAYLNGVHERALIERLLRDKK